jgi:hypothetical protein
MNRSERIDTSNAIGKPTIFADHSRVAAEFDLNQGRAARGSLGWLDFPKEGAMTALSVAQVYSTVADGVARAWRRWIGGDEVGDMECCAQPQLERMAQDIGVSVSELHRLSRLGPDAADLLPKRMEALGLDRAEVSRVEPAVLHDMQRVCALCEHHKRCARDLAGRHDDHVWQDYCPNVATLKALNAMPWESRRDW